MTGADRALGKAQAVLRLAEETLTELRNHVDALSDLTAEPSEVDGEVTCRG